jgi:hypothetical protein
MEGSTLESTEVSISIDRFNPPVEGRVNPNGSKISAICAFSVPVAAHSILDRVSASRKALPAGKVNFAAPPSRCPRRSQAIRDYEHPRSIVVW